MTRRLPYRRAVGSLREEGVTVLDVTEYEPDHGAAHLDAFPWAAALQMVTGQKGASGA